MRTRVSSTEYFLGKHLLLEKKSVILLIDSTNERLYFTREREREKDIAATNFSLLGCALFNIYCRDNYKEQFIIFHKKEKLTHAHTYTQIFCRQRLIF